ncbi:AraC family transcriptional regulator [Chitinophaga arvensicola]|uniref:Helix-turn-helix domain-containing protein n=1 Tax=Chitinophaga arvensicola TaxID=29529 RepID=A0A1I0SBH4_9BACT|nr:helix-turn-helix domain-containing protein [Chitinophaga arvensicola]SEW54038.1 Helix-turn-helix domain-containing protein [Chitinophaga arvensicola]
MNAIVYLPKNELREAIDYFWYHDANTVQLSSYNIPFLHQELIINFGDHLSVQANAQTAFGYSQQGGVSGLFTRPVITRAKGRYKALGIMLKPFGLYRLCGFSAAKLREHPLTLPDIWGAAAFPLLADLQAAEHAEDKFRILEKFLLRMAQPQTVPEEILALQESGSLQKGHVRANISGKHISSKKYIQTATKVLGMPPKKYAQLCLVNKAVTQIAHQTETPLTAVAYENGFYDQAHFIRVFKSFAGMTPSKYKDAVQQGHTHETFPNTIFI